MSKKDLILLLLILCIAGAFRLTNIGLSEFKADEGINLFLASRPLFGYPIPPGGTISSIGILNFPLMNYILFPFTLVSTDPFWITFVIAFINTLSIGFLFLLFKKYHGTIAATFSIVLLSLSPWMILFSRKIWIQDLIVPMMVPFLFSVYKIVFDRNYKYFFLYAFTLLLLVQIHQSTLFFLLPFSLFLLLSVKKLKLKPFALGVMAGLIPLIPFLLFQAQNACPDCSAIFNSGDKLGERNLIHFFRIFQILGSGNFFFIFGNDIVQFAQEYSLFYRLRQILYIEYLLFLAGCVYFFTKYKKLRFFTYSVVSLPALYYLFKIQPEIHYYIIIVPFAFLFIGILLGSLFEQKNVLFRIPAVLIFLIIVFAATSFNYAFFDFLKKNEGLSGDYGQTLEKTYNKIQELYSAYQGTDRYDEMILAHFVPRNSIRGDSQIGLMLYDYEEIGKNLEAYEKRLIKAEIDNNAYHPIFAFHTQENSEEEIAVLRMKSKQNPQVYEKIYNTAYRQYLNTMLLKREYIQATALYIELPMHWMVEQSKNKATILADKGTIHIRKGSIRQEREACKSEEIIILSQTASLYTCFVKGLWEQTILYSELGFTIEIEPHKKTISEDIYFKDLAPNYLRLFGSFRKGR